LRSGGVAPEKGACYPRSCHAHECASIHAIFRPEIILTIHGSSPLRKVEVWLFVGSVREILEAPSRLIGRESVCLTNFTAGVSGTGSMISEAIFQSFRP
jgi:hypothetical protein